MKCSDVLLINAMPKFAVRPRRNSYAVKPPVKPSTTQFATCSTHSYFTAGLGARAVHPGWLLNPRYLAAMRARGSLARLYPTFDSHALFSGFPVPDLG
jgi:hypothetical protein